VLCGHSSQGIQVSELVALLTHKTLKKHIVIPINQTNKKVSPLGQYPFFSFNNQTIERKSREMNSK
jgi:hypothetical protein